MIIRDTFKAYSTVGRSLGFLSGGSKENSENSENQNKDEVRPMPFCVIILSPYKSGLQWILPVDKGSG